ncbi:hypothetical protein D9O36_19720, partial [Zobellia amurskyensis]|nr:hypothetical protein [Zobellia amurskyensis]
MFIFSFTCIQSQQNEDSSSANMVTYNASGGDALSNSGSVAYSLGGVFYTVIESPHILVCEGVQQAEMLVEEEILEEEEEVVVEEEIPAEEIDPIAEEEVSEPE